MKIVENKPKKKIIANGLCRFYYDSTSKPEQIGIEMDNLETIMKRHNLGKNQATLLITDPMYTWCSGNEFIDLIEQNKIHNTICEIIYVNGYRSNLGITTSENLYGSGFLVNPETFKELCNKYEILVNWSAKEE